MRPYAKALLASLLLAYPATVPAQYIYLDANGDGAHSDGDLLNPSGPTTLGVWLDTSKNRNGQAVTCPTGELLTLTSYQFVLLTLDGSVAWGAYNNLLSDFFISLGIINDGIHYSAGFSGGNLPPGLYHLGNLTINSYDGSPQIVIKPSYPEFQGPIPLTMFGSSCPGQDFDNTMKFGQDWLDADGIVSPSLWRKTGVPLSKRTGHQIFPTAVGEPQGGAIIAWADRPTGGTWEIYAQRVDSWGGIEWGADGIAVCDTIGDQHFPVICSDGHGGAIIAWHDTRAGADLYAQRIDSTGAKLWASQGIPLCTASGDQLGPTLTSDSLGGVIAVWSDDRVPGNRQIYANRVMADGTVHWASNGIPVSTSLANPKRDPTVVADGSGGCLVGWTETSTSDKVKVQRLDAAGVQKWSVDGVTVPDSTAFARTPQLAPTGDGGAIVVWQYAGTDGLANLRARRVSPVGLFPWNQVTICSQPGEQKGQTVAALGSGGAVVSWEDSRDSGSDPSVYVQKIGFGGDTTLWASQGIPVSNIPGSGNFETGVFDTAGGGAFVIWMDMRQTPGTPGYYCQMYDATGARLLPQNGSMIAERFGGTTFGPRAAWDGVGWIITWADLRNGFTFQAFAGRVNAHGTVITAVQPSRSPKQSHLTVVCRPNPFNPVAQIDYVTPRSGRVEVNVLDVNGRLVRRLLDRFLSAGQQRTHWDGNTIAGTRASSGVYLVSVRCAGESTAQKVVLLK